jgi:aspartyl-tRNA(Asn)/glutamyl-tRNA(Gln) amidotransferase subunit B
MRCDVNVSVRPDTQKELGTKAELKNLNSFHGVLHSLHYEVRRQTEMLERGEKIVQETRRWDPDKGITTSMRIKEDAHDYRYFPEPDLMPVVLDRNQVDAWKAALPELPRIRKQRFIDEYSLPEYDAGVLVAERDIADFFEAAAKLVATPKSVSNWIMTEVMRVLSERDCSISQLKITPENLAYLIKLVEKKTVNMTGAKEVFEVLIDSGGDPATIVEDKGLVQVSDIGEIEAFVDQALADNPKSVEDFRNGKTAAVKFLIGQVMRLSRGKANPQMVSQMISEKLG